MAKTSKIIALALAIGLGILVVSYFLKQGPDAPTVVVYTSVDQVFSEPVLRNFEKKTGIRVRAVYDTEETKSTGVLNRLIAEAKNPQADVFWSGDPVRPFLLADRGLVEPYMSPEARQIPSGFKATDGTWTGFAARARVLLVNRKKLGDRAMPRSVRDLADPRWRGEVAIANPVFGTTTMHVAAWFSTLGKEAANAFLDALKDNQIKIASSNGEVKRLVVSGEVTFGLTDTDDAFVAAQSGAQVEVVYPDQEEMGTLIMPTVALVLRHGPNPESARHLIDYLLSAEVETLLSESAAHMPLRPDARHPDHIRSVGELQSMKVDYADVAKWMKEIQPLLRRWAGL
ncbi:MAG: extracellular solute-binding protein [Proteobacteria bacterium]|nr:extracellular solute-binding protein [Pseudomonadota bacterium]